MKTLLIRWIGLLAVFAGMMNLTAGCTAIQSSAVETLIEQQGIKIDSAISNAGWFKTQNEARREAYENALADLNTALEQVQTFESLMALIFSSNQNVEEKRGVDAQAVTYLAGTLYWAKQAGLEQTVQEQFKADFDALDSLAVYIESSWQSLSTLNRELASVSKKSGLLRNVDPTFIAALVDQTKVELPGIESLIRRSQEVNVALSRAARFEPVFGTTPARGQSFMGDMVDFIESIQPDAAPSDSTPETQAETTDGGPQ